MQDVQEITSGESSGDAGPSISPIGPEHLLDACAFRIPANLQARPWRAQVPNGVGAKRLPSPFPPVLRDLADVAHFMRSRPHIQVHRRTITRAPIAEVVHRLLSEDDP